MKRVLAFFGAFNPPTVAHIELARFAMERTGRDGVVFVPSKSVYIRGEQGKDAHAKHDAKAHKEHTVAAKVRLHARPPFCEEWRMRGSARL